MAPSNPCSRFLREDSAQDLVEYGILIAVLALGTAMALRSVTASVATVFTAVGSALTSGV